MTTELVTTTHTPNSRFLCSKSEEVTLTTIRAAHIIPVFAKDNMPLISQVEFIATTADIAAAVFGESYQNLDIRLSHPIKGRTFEARNKKASELLAHEKTVYFERCAFLMEFPICDTVQGEQVWLTVAGVKAYNLDNLMNTSERGTQSFKIAVGFKVQVCTNLCTWSDGARLDLKVQSLDALGAEIKTLFENYSQAAHLEAMRTLSNYHLTEQQFATLIGKARLYQHLPTPERNELPRLQLGDGQVNTVAKCYYNDPNFSRRHTGEIDLWRFLNCCTEGVKSSYIDTFLDRSLNAFEFTQGVAKALDGDETYSWFLN